MRGEIGLEGLVLSLERFEFIQLGVLEVRALEHDFFVAAPFFVDVAFMLEFSRQMLQALQAHQLGQKPLLETLVLGREKGKGN